MKFPLTNMNKAKVRTKRKKQLMMAKQIQQLANFSKKDPAATGYQERGADSTILKFARNTHNMEPVSHGDATRVKTASFSTPRCALIPCGQVNVFHSTAASDTSRGPHAIKMLTKQVSQMKQKLKTEIKTKLIQLNKKINPWGQLSQTIF